MLEFQARQQTKKRLFSRPVFVGLFVLALIMMKAAWNLYGKQIESENNLKQVLVRVEELQDREMELSAQIARLETNKGIEEEIRKKFSVVKDGEHMVVLVDEVASTSVEEDKDVGFFKNMWNKMKGVFTDEEGDKEEE